MRTSTPQEIRAWKKRYEELKAFKKEHGHCRVPIGYPPSPALRRWVDSQRFAYRLGRLRHRRQVALDALGFVWEPENAAWQQRYAELREFKSRHGHCMVPTKYAPNPPLGNWISIQRFLYNKGRLSAERIKRLNELGFVWGQKRRSFTHHTLSKPVISSPTSTPRRRPKQAVWKKRYEELKAFKKEHGHCSVPRNYAPNLQLGRWVQNKRQQYKCGRVTDRQEELLNDLGFQWDQLDLQWNIRFSNLWRFHKRHGHCRVPARYPKNPQLAEWVSTQRKEFKQGRLRPDRRERLAQLGFEWDGREAVWMEQLCDLHAFLREHGHQLVPRKYSKNPKLGLWVYRQRQLKRQDKLDDFHEFILTFVGFEWEPKNDR